MPIEEIENQQKGVTCYYMIAVLLAALNFGPSIIAKWIFFFAVH